MDDIWPACRGSSPILLPSHLLRQTSFAGKGGKMRYLPLHEVLINDYLAAARHGANDRGALFPPDPQQTAPDGWTARSLHRWTAASQHDASTRAKSPFRAAALISLPVTGTTSARSRLPRSISFVTVPANPFHEIKKPREQR